MEESIPLELEIYYSNIINKKLNEIKYEEKPMPLRLVMTPDENVCQFCKNPNGKCNLKYINIEQQLGFVCCNKKECKDNMEQRIYKLFEEIGWNTIKKFANTYIKVKRSSGIIENDWIITCDNSFMGPIVVDDCTYIPVHKIIIINNKEETLKKYISLEEFNELNNL